MCVCVYVYIYTHTHTHTHTYIYVYTHTHETTLLAQDCVQRLTFVLAVLNSEYRYCDGIRN